MGRGPAGGGSRGGGGHGGLRAAVRARAARAGARGTLVAKPKSVFVCSQCGATALKWMGMCPSCGEAGTLSEQAAERGARAVGPAASPVPL
ncbi:MAG TPA: hypothetical protein VJ789_14765, partial [Burkholderiales bacterium]|nr:hypothetical protein [Burkholderiales bacterium]